MYAICKVSEKDVAKCVADMVTKEYKLPIFQFTDEDYADLEENQHNVISSCVKVQDEAVYAINLGTRRIHTKKCDRHGKNVIGARIIDAKATGLKICKSCMK